MDRQAKHPRAADPGAAAWAASGAMALTGRPAGPPLGAPAALIALIERAAAILDRHRAAGPQLDGLALLGERAALAGLSRGGTISCGGGARLVPAQDGWLAVSLARPEDLAALPAWLSRDVTGDDPWPTVHEVVATMPTAALDAQAALLGLPIAAVGSVGPGHSAPSTCPSAPVGSGGTAEPPGRSERSRSSTFPPSGPDPSVVSC